MRFKTIEPAIVAVEALGGELRSLTHGADLCSCELFLVLEDKTIVGVGPTALAAVDDAYNELSKVVMSLREKIKPQPSGQARLGRAVTSGRDATLRR